MRKHLLLLPVLPVLLAFGCDKAPAPAAPTPAPDPGPAPERIPVFIVGVEPTPVPLGDPAKIILEMSKPMPDATAWALFRAVSPDGGYNNNYKAEFDPGSTTSTTPIFTIDSHDRAGGYAGLIGEWTLTLEDASFPLQISDPREIKYTVAYRAAVRIGGTRSNPIKVGDDESLVFYMMGLDNNGRYRRPLYRDVDIPIETTTPAGDSTVSTITFTARESEHELAVSPTIVGEWRYRILGDRLPEGVMLGNPSSYRLWVEP